MILLDTNVISEPLRHAPDSAVVAWLDRQPIETLYLAAISLAELRFGVASMPEGKRRTVLNRRLEEEVLPLFIGRVLPFDSAASLTYAQLMSATRAVGLAIGAADGYIAATAAANHLMIATRDTSPFEAAGVPVIDPWRQQP